MTAFEDRPFHEQFWGSLHALELEVPGPVYEHAKPILQKPMQLIVEAIDGEMGFQTADDVRNFLSTGIGIGPVAFDAEEVDGGEERGG